MRGQQRSRNLTRCTAARAELFSSLDCPFTPDTSVRHGLGTKRNGEEALRRYREAAEAGDALGKYYYAVYLNEGQNASDAMVEQDIPMARKLWKEVR